jgi:hypothetical protein
MLLCVIMIAGCKKCEEKPDLQVPEFINPIQLNGYIQLYISTRTTISTDVSNGVMFYNTTNPGTVFQINGNITVRNRFFKTTMYSPTINQEVDYLWNADIAPYFVQENLQLDSGSIITVYRVLANFGEGDAQPSTTTSSIVLSVNNGVPSVISQDSHQSPSLKSKQYTIITEQIVYKGEGLYMLGYIADSNNDVGEDDEDNNSNNSGAANIDVR